MGFFAEALIDRAEKRPSLVGNYLGLPPIKAPFCYFLTVLVFGILAALLLPSSGTDLFASRWTPALRALIVDNGVSLRNLLATLAVYRAHQQKIAAVIATQQDQTNP